MTFNEKIINLRKIRGLTQDEFASAVGVSRQAVYKWESGQSYPEVAKLLEIKILFGISIDDLLDDKYEVVLPEKKKRKKNMPKTEVNVASTEKKTASETVAAAVLSVKEEDVKVDFDNTLTEVIEESVPVTEEPVGTNKEETPVQKETEPEEISAQNENVQVPVAEPVKKEAEEIKTTSEPKAAWGDERNVKNEKKVGFFGRLFGRK